MPNHNSHEQQASDRSAYTQAIVQSTALYKIIVAGPGTGKSFTFKALLETKNGQNLALTFINNLASELQKDLGELAESYTFHGYCKKLLHRISVDGIDTDFHYFPKLPILVALDAKYLEKDLTEFEDAFHTLTEGDRISFFLGRGNYYNSVGYNDSVYRVLKYFQSADAPPPSFCQIVVDEYQDFNPLEVAFIDELARSSPVLIAGDDDQAIYNFKNASPRHVREKSSHPDFTRFELPYCSRCTQVIVDAVHDVANKAQSLNKLQDRIVKQYICYLPDKETDSAQHPKIIHANCSTNTRRAPYISKFVEREINTIPQEEIDHAREKGYPCVLIAGPSHYTKQIYDYLATKFTNIEFKKRKSEEIDIIDGYRILINNEDSNLGWRIVLECVAYTEKVNAIKDTYENGQQLSEVINEEFKSEQLNIVSIMKKLIDGEEISNEDETKATECCAMSIDELKKSLGSEGVEQEGMPDEEDTNVSIKITTINGAKGLSANYVFLVGMNNTQGSHKGFPSDSSDPTDNAICQFIVGITRTRKKCFLISNRGFGAVYNIRKSIFIDWIDSSRIESIVVNAEYFRNN